MRNGAAHTDAPQSVPDESFQRFPNRSKTQPPPTTPTR